LSETSPYLKQHAQNPVDWYPWGPEAFKKAKTENKPIFLSIGYSSCHWCHVMAHESFEDTGVANFLNENFVSIKVDREERPDVDEIYMKSVVTMTGSGGWPLSVFLTPSLEPFYGGTYFPPTPRYGMPSFSNVIKSISKAWKSDRKRLVESAAQMKTSLAEMYAFSRNEDLKISSDPLDECYASLVSSFDETYGGFGDAPKFPTPSNHFFLLRYQKMKKVGEKSLALSIVKKSLEGMMRGGIYDQIGGGFHRYSTDRYWLVPHFEKMLYDNALLIILYTEAFSVTKDPKYAGVVRETIRWAARELRTEKGAFRSAIDADSSEGEGIFYTWTMDELKNALTAADIRADEIDAVAKYFSVTREGNFEGGRTILTSRSAGVNGDSHLEELISKAKFELLKSRDNRPRPSIDSKILIGWNGLMVSALSKAYSTFGDDQNLTYAESCAKEILESNVFIDKDGSPKLSRISGPSEKSDEAVLDDYAFLINGLLDLYEAGFDSEFLGKSVALAKSMISGYFDSSGGGFFLVTEKNQNLIVRPKDAFDGALPSGNSMAALACLRLAEITGQEQFREKSTQTLLTFWEAINRQPASFTQMLVALQFFMGPTKEIVISGTVDDASTELLIRAIRDEFLPNSIIVFAEKNSEAISPLVEGRILGPDASPRVFVCTNFSCKLPSKTEIEVRQALQE
jgi:uncharacterized protein